MEAENDKENINPAGMKRSLQLVIKEGELQNARGVGKKQKYQNGDFDPNSPNVGVASLEWPQVDK